MGDASSGISASYLAKACRYLIRIRVCSITDGVVRNQLISKRAQKASTFYELPVGTYLRRRISPKNSQVSRWMEHLAKRLRIRRRGRRGTKSQRRRAKITETDVVAWEYATCGREFHKSVAFPAFCLFSQHSRLYSAMQHHSERYSMNHHLERTLQLPTR